jgi:hypothetical protein
MCVSGKWEKTMKVIVVAYFKAMYSHFSGENEVDNEQLQP